MKLQSWSEFASQGYIQPLVRFSRSICENTTHPGLDTNSEPHWKYFDFNKE